MPSEDEGELGRGPEAVRRRKQSPERRLRRQGHSGAGHPGRRKRGGPPPGALGRRDAAHTLTLGFWLLNPWFFLFCN